MRQWCLVFAGQASGDARCLCQGIAGAVTPDSLELRGQQLHSDAKFLKKRYEEHLEQFDVIGEFVRAMDYMMPLCACGLKEALPMECFRNVDSHDGRAMLLTYHQNLCDLCELV